MKKLLKLQKKLFLMLLKTVEEVNPEVVEEVAEENIEESNQEVTE
jgi:hypothetical protein